MPSTWENVALGCVLRLCVAANGARGEVDVRCAYLTATILQRVPHGLRMQTEPSSAVLLSLVCVNFKTGGKQEASKGIL